MKLPLISKKSDQAAASVGVLGVAMTGKMLFDLVREVSFDDIKDEANRPPSLLVMATTNDEAEQFARLLTGEGNPIGVGTGTIDKQIWNATSYDAIVVHDPLSTGAAARLNVSVPDGAWPEETSQAVSLLVTAMALSAVVSLEVQPARATSAPAVKTPGRLAPFTRSRPAQREDPDADQLQSSTFHPLLRLGNPNYSRGRGSVAVKTLAREVPNESHAPPNGTDRSWGILIPGSAEAALRPRSSGDRAVVS